MQHATHSTVREAAPEGATENLSGASRPPPRRGAGSWAQIASLIAIAAGAVVMSSTSMTGCGSDVSGAGGGTTTASTTTSSSTGTGGEVPFCQGGFIRPDPSDPKGICEGKCTAAACGPDNTCVDNRCALTCVSHLECGDGLSQECVPAKEDDTAKDILICKPNGKGSVGAKCLFGTECDMQFACPDGKKCDPACTGAGCACPADQCKSLFCRTSGEGDAEAFCTLKDCHADADCPGGFWCRKVRDPHQICGTQKGDDNFCGTTTEPCVDPAMNAATGATYEEAAQCAVRAECGIRRQCAPCTTDVDCSLVPGQHCTQVGPEKVCTRDCSMESDCELGFECKDNACQPRFGACVGTGKYCEPCRNDLDCDGPTGKKACVSFGGAERVCIDVTASQACTVDADCPVAPDGRPGMCSGSLIGVKPGDAIYHKCIYPPYTEATNNFSCWCGNKGTGCYTGKDCCSGTCAGGNKNLQIVGDCK